MRNFDLNERLVDFAVCIIDIAEHLPNSYIVRHIAAQLIRSGTAPCLQYAEAQSAESRQDFIHKMKISVKELRETQNCLKLIRKKGWYNEINLNAAIEENNQLISIFVKSIATAQKNLAEE